MLVIACDEVVGLTGTTPVRRASGSLQIPGGVLAQGAHERVEGTAEFLFILGFAHGQEEGLKSSICAGEIGGGADDGDHLGATLLERPWIVIAEHLGQIHDGSNPLLEPPVCVNGATPSDSS